MDKNAIKKYAIWARRELITRVAGQAAKYGVTEDGWGNTDADSVEGRVLSAAEKKQRAAFIDKVRTEGYEQAIEEVAYTWFNRFCALRYMEVNGYLPSHIRIFTNDAGEFKPQILDETLHLDLDGLDMEKVLKLKEDANQTEELFRYLLITQCNALSSILPGMFQKIEDYTELLLPENLLREGSVIESLITEIPEEDWTDQIQIIGWLYQYYNVEKKDEIFVALNRKVKITKENIPAATQLFTPDWIVRYMVENSLGRLWIEGHPNEELKSNWKYYLNEAEQEPEVETQLAEIRKEYAALKPEDIKCIDPCCGSGHILVYMFDVLLQIYESYGYTSQDAVASIVENNLYGLDIDERAAQLAYFAVMMKARSYDKRFFSRKIQSHVYSIVESNDLDKNLIDYFVGNDLKLKNDFVNLINEMYDAKEYGSIINISHVDFPAMHARVENIMCSISFHVSEVEDLILPLINVAETLAQKYDVVVTNPPYRGMTDCDKKLNDYVLVNYPNSKSNLYSVFMERLCSFASKESMLAMITMQSWMYLSSYKTLRQMLINSIDFVNMSVLGSNAFDSGDVGTVVQTTTFVIRNSHIKHYMSLILDLNMGKSSDEKKKNFMNQSKKFLVSSTDFLAVANCQFMYDVTQNMLVHFINEKRFSEYAIAKPGMQTSDNDRFLRIWSEVDFNNIGFGLSHDEAMLSDYKWFPYNKGVGYRKWFGNNDYIVNFKNDGEELKYWLTHNPKDPTTKSWSRNLRNYSYYFDEGITFTAIGLEFSARINGPGYLFDTKGPMIFGQKLTYLCGFVNGKVFDAYNRLLCKQMTKSADSVNMVPVRVIRENEVNELVNRNISISKSDWDSFENSWDFLRHPLVRFVSTISNAFSFWQEECDARISQLKSNEEELNRIFISIYGLQDELNPEIEYKDVTVRKADLSRDIKSLISYAVGCMFGRYSLDMDGLAYGGGDWDASKYQTYQPDHNGILPICDDEYFKDDIVGYFIDFIRTVYGEETLEENLQFIADALGGNGSSRDVIRKYFLNDFYADHCKIYQKRPIYWLFDSGKKNGFKCLIYMHRYRPDTIARIRTDYVHEQQARYRTTISDMEKQIDIAPSSERIKMSKSLKKLNEQAEELLNYEEKIHHLADQFIYIDLDDGVKVNYAKFQDVLAKIK